MGRETKTKGRASVLSFGCWWTRQPHSQVCHSGDRVPPPPSIGNLTFRLIVWTEFMGKGPQFLHSEGGFGSCLASSMGRRTRRGCQISGTAHIVSLLKCPPKASYVMITISHVSLQAFTYFKCKPIFLALLSLSSNITTLGKIVAHTGPFQLDSLVTWM